MKKIIFKNQTKTEPFHIGDFVWVSNKTHDHRIPASRLGHIIRAYRSPVHYSNREPVDTGAWELLMVNGNKLIFHEMFLEHANERL